MKMANVCNVCFYEDNSLMCYLARYKETERKIRMGKGFSCKTSSFENFASTRSVTREAKG